MLGQAIILRAGTLGSVFLLSLAGCSNEDSAPALPLAVRVVKAGSDVNIARDTYSGVVVPRIEADLSFRVSGRLVERRVDVGQVVDAGQVLGSLDPAPLQLVADDARAALADAEAVAAKAESDLRRNRPLVERGIVAPATLTALEAAARSARARVEQSRSRVRLAQSDVGFTSLSTPSAGVVTEVKAEVGQYLQPGQTVFRVARRDQLEVAVDVPEMRIAKIREGMSGIVRFSADGATESLGVVREIAPAADPSTRTFRVKLALTSGGDRVRSGMTATVAFEAPRGRSVELPSSSLFQRGSQPAVWVVKDGKVELRPVALGELSARTFTVVNGLHPGEVVVTAGVHRLNAGQAVRLWDGRLP